MPNAAGGTDTLFTNVRVLDLASRSIYVFFSRFHPELFESQAFESLPGVQDQHAVHEHFARLAGRDSLRVVGVREVVVSVPDLDAFRKAYSALLSPAPRREGDRWDLPAGPDLRLVHGDEHRVERIIVGVASLERARERLERSALLGPERGDSILLRRDRIGGIEIVLVPAERARSTPDIREHLGQSPHVDEEYRILVGLPDGYAGSARSYPVLYVLDAEKSFGLARDVADWLSWAGEIPPLIVVGISYGEDHEAWWTKRSRDLTPWPDRGRLWGEWPLAGGAEDFRSFLGGELFPLIDGSYRTTGDRALVGLSFGGLFGAHDLLSADRLFGRYVLVSPALAWDDERLLAMETPASVGGAVVYSAIGGMDDPEITEPWRTWSARLLSQRDEGVVYISEEFPAETHISVFPAAMTRGLKAIYDAKWRPPRL